MKEGFVQTPPDWNGPSSSLPHSCEDHAVDRPLACSPQHACQGQQLWRWGSKAYLVEALHRHERALWHPHRDHSMMTRIQLNNVQTKLKCQWSLVHCGRRGSEEFTSLVSFRSGVRTHSTMTRDRNLQHRWTFSIGFCGFGSFPNFPRFAVCIFVRNSPPISGANRPISERRTMRTILSSQRLSWCFSPHGRSSRCAFSCQE